MPVQEFTNKQDTEEIHSYFDYKDRGTSIVNAAGCIALFINGLQQ